MSRRLAHPGLLFLSASILLPGSALGQDEDLVLIHPEFVPTLPSPQELARLPVDPRVRALARELDSDAYAERERAMAELMEREFDHHQLYALMYQDKLGPEQRHRLLEVVRHRLIEAPRGAVGISMRPRQVDPAAPIEIEVVELIRGLPAERVLQVGDRITSVDGRPLRSDEDLVQAIQSKRPGEKLALSVRRLLRDGEGQVRRDANDDPLYERRDVSVELGSTAQLFDDPRREVRKSEFVRMREREARDAGRHYGPEPVAVRIRSGVRGTFVPGPDQAVLGEVDEHPAIVTLLQQKRLLDAAGVTYPQEVLGDWERTLQVLVLQVETVGLAETERAYLLRVVDRYRQILGR